MRFVPRAILAGGAGFAVSLLAACGGSSGLLSGGQSSTLVGQLRALSSAVASGQCGAATSAGDGLTQAADNLPSSVDAQLRAYLADGAVTVEQLAPSACAATQSASTTHTPTSSSSTSHSSSTSSTPSSSSSSSTSSGTSTTSTNTSTSSTTTSSTTTPTTSSTTTGSTTSNSGGGGLGGGSPTSG